jgi:hypothetical protein
MAWKIALSVICTRTRDKIVPFDQRDNMKVRKKHHPRRDQLHISSKPSILGFSFASAGLSELPEQAELHAIHRAVSRPLPAPFYAT